MSKKNKKLIVTVSLIAVFVAVYFTCFRDIGAEDIRNYREFFMDIVLL